MIRFGFLLSVWFPAVVSAAIVLGPESPLVAPSVADRTHPAIAVAANATLVVWLEQSNGRQSVEGVLLLPNGTYLELEIAANDAPGQPRIATDGSDFLVVWSAGSTGYLRSRPVTASGILGQTRDLVARRTWNPAVVFNGNAYVVAWEEPADQNPLYYLGMGTRIDAQRFDGQGVPIGGEPILIAGGDDTAAFEPALASDGQHVLIAWTSGLLCKRAACHASAAYDLLARTFNHDLSAQSGVFTVAADSGVNEVGARVTRSAGGWFVAWTAWRGVTPPGNISGGGEIYDCGWTTVSEDGGIITEVRPPLADPVFNFPLVEGSVDRQLGAATPLQHGDVIAYIDSSTDRAVIESVPSSYDGASFPADEVAMASVGDRITIAYSRQVPGSVSRIFIRYAAFEPERRRRAAR
jgi:hypothetical protein